MALNSKKKVYQVIIATNQFKIDVKQAINYCRRINRQKPKTFSKKVLTKGNRHGIIVKHSRETTKTKRQKKAENTR